MALFFLESLVFNWSRETSEKPAKERAGTEQGCGHELHDITAVTWVLGDHEGQRQEASDDGHADRRIGSPECEHNDAAQRAEHDQQKDNGVSV